MTRKENRFLTFEERKQVKLDIESNIFLPSIAANYNVSVSTIKREKANMRKKNVNSQEIDPKRKKIQKIRYIEVEAFVLKHFDRVREKGYPISGPIFKLLLNIIVKKLPIILIQVMKLKKNTKMRYLEIHGWIRLNKGTK